jgi:putative transcriptional regulator
MTQNTYQSDVDQSIHELASALHGVGLVSDKKMKQFDESCLVPVKEYTAEEIRALREREEISQALLARLLNVTTNCVSKYEQGERKAKGAVLKLLSMLDRNGAEALL